MTNPPIRHEAEPSLGLWLSILSALFYLSFLSQHYIGDGIRWIPVITRSSSPPVGDIRHLFSPTLGWIGCRLASALGYQGNPIPLVQSLNAFLAGLGIGLYYLLMERLTRDRWVSAWGSLLLMFSYSYSTHATDMTEIMPSVPFLIGSSLLALRSARLGNPLLAVASALSLTGAGLLYVTSLLSAPALLYLIFKERPRDKTSRRLARTFFLSLSILVPLSFLSGYLLRCSGVAEALQALLLFRERGLADPDFKWIHLGGTLFGWAGAVFGLRDFHGGLHLLTHLETGTARWNIGALLFTALMTAALVLRLFQGWERRPDPRRTTGRSGALFGFLWLVPMVAFLSYAGPANNKFWVHPLLGFVCWISCLLASLLRASPPKNRVKVWACVLLCIVGGVNLSAYLVPRRFTPSPYGEDARRVAVTLGKEDLLVSEAYDDVSIYVGSIFHRNVLSFFTRGADLSFDNAALSRSLQETFSACLNGGGRLYFLCLFDPPPEGWGAGLGGKRGLDYQMLDSYRLNSNRLFLIPSLTREYRRPVWLWEYKESP